MMIGSSDKLVTIMMNVHTIQILMIVGVSAGLAKTEENMSVKKHGLMICGKKSTVLSLLTGYHDECDSRYIVPSAVNYCSY